MRNLRLEPLSPDDIQEAARLLEEAFEEMAAGLGHKEDDPDFFESFIPEHLKSGDGWVCRSEDEIAAAVLVNEEGDCLYVSHLGVGAAYRGQGIGAWLLDRLEEKAGALNLSWVRLHTAEFHKAAIRFYLREGFEIFRKGLPEHGRDQFLRVYMQRPVRTG